MSAPTWKSAPDVAGFWVFHPRRGSVGLVTLIDERDLHAHAKTSGYDARYYGPIPEDKNES